jgi:hypothetical protein
VRYTLPEGKRQILASRYKLYLTTAEELFAELLRERKALEFLSAMRSNRDHPDQRQRMTG